MLFYDVNVLVILIFVDPLNAILLVVAVKLLAEGGVGRLAVVKVGCGTAIKSNIGLNVQVQD
jgi:hypothetical protein